MGSLAVLGIFAGLMILFVIGIIAMHREARKRVTEWAESNKYWVKSSLSVYEPVEVEWAKPGTSVFR